MFCRVDIATTRYFIVLRRHTPARRHDITPLLLLIDATLRHAITIRRARQRFTYATLRHCCCRHDAAMRAMLLSLLPYATPARAFIIFASGAMRRQHVMPARSCLCTGATYTL